jgi:hypothetical protein
MKVFIGPQGLFYGVLIGSQGLLYGGTQRSSRAIMWGTHRPQGLLKRLKLRVYRLMP